jgi:aldose 1-epimerase
MIDTIVIRNGELSAEIVPALGAGLARFDHGGIPMLRPWPAGGSNDPFDLACNLLLPWSNRISGGGFSFEGVFHELLPNLPGEPFPIHGNGFSSTWTVDSADAHEAALSLSSDGPGPYKYEAVVRYVVTRQELRLTLRIVNRSAIRLPFGLGIHPWFPRTRLTTLEAPATAVCLERPDHLPDRFEPLRDHPEWNFTQPCKLPKGWINNAFAGWDGTADISWPEHHAGLRIEASPPLDFYVVYSPSEDSDFFCFEPVSHVVDAHNRSPTDRWNGLSVLDPDQGMDARCRFAVA